MGADADLAELGNLARRLVDSWNRADARGFAALFTPAAEYVSGAGERIRGREAIAALLEETTPPARVSVRGQPTIECGDKSGEITFAWSTGPRRGRIQCACVRQGSSWLIEVLHNDEDAESG